MLEPSYENTIKSFREPSRSLNFLMFILMTLSAPRQLKLHIILLKGTVNLPKVRFLNKNTGLLGTSAAASQLSLGLIMAERAEGQNTFPTRSKPSVGKSLYVIVCIHTAPVKPTVNHKMPANVQVFRFVSSNLSFYNFKKID